MTTKELILQQKSFTKQLQSIAKLFEKRFCLLQITLKEKGNG
jgi:hypothetical protein